MKLVQAPDDDPEVLPEAGPVRIHLGCNQHPREGYINVDIEPFKGVDVVADLEKPWPWPDSHADEIVCADLPEHLRMWWDEPDPDEIEVAEQHLNSGKALEACAALMHAIRNPKRHYGIIHFMNEAHRVLKPGGRLDALIPSTDGRGWAQDPTHVSYWNENSLLYYTDPNYWGLYPHLIKARFRPLKVTTSVRNIHGVSWVRAILEADKA